MRYVYIHTTRMHGHEHVADHIFSRKRIGDSYPLALSSNTSSNSTGLATTLRILAGVMSVLMATSLCYKPFRSPLEQLYDIKRVPGPFLDLRVWKNKAFVIYTVAVSLFMLGYFIPYVHIVS